MDHLFPSKREELDVVKGSILKLEDMLLILNMEETDKVHLLARKDVLIKNETIRDAVLRHCDRLGLLPQDVNKVVDLTKYEKEWSEFLLCKTNHVGNPFVECLNTTLRKLYKTKEDLNLIEYDSGSSSYSDYSASATTSSEEESEGEESSTE